MSYNPQQKNIKGAFGELITTHKTPIVQISNKYRIDPATLNVLETFEATGGSADNDANMFRCQTGTSVGGYGVIRSKETLNYRAGQGVECQITASFTTGIANSLQFAGLFNLTETLAFGYDGANFSCIHEYNGLAELQVIEVTATGAGTCTVTLAGTASSGIAVTSSTTETNAREITNGLKADALANSWRFEQVDNKVFCISKSVGNKTGTMSVSGGVTATITEVVAGVSKTSNNTSQSSWNVTTSPFSGFDPTQLNLYKIQFGYLGIANINFFVYDPDTREFILVHSIEWANANSIPHLGTPNLKIGWTAASLGSSGTNLTVKGASGSIMLEGDEVVKNNTFADSDIIASVGTTYVNLVTIKNRLVYGDIYNLGKIFPLRISIDNEHNKGLLVRVLRNATVAGTINYNYKDESNSIALVDVAGTTVTGGDLIDAFTVPANGDVILDLSILKSDLLPNETITVAARTITATATNTTVTITWKEEK